MKSIQSDSQNFWRVVEGTNCFMAVEGTEVLRGQPRVSPLRRFSGKADELFLKVRNEPEWSKSPACEERGMYGTYVPGPLWAA